RIRHRRSEKVPAEAPLAKGGWARGVRRPPRSIQLLQSCCRALAAGGEQRLDSPVTSVTGRQQPGGIVQMVCGEGDDLEAAHATYTRRDVAEDADRRRARAGRRAGAGERVVPR